MIILKGVAAVLAVCSWSLVWAQTAQNVISQTGIDRGLFVTLGVSDGQLERDLALKGTILAHGLALEESACKSARETILAANLYGLASVEQLSRLTSLPYASNLVDVLIADLDGLGDHAPSIDEMRRVLVPNGVTYLKKNGKGLLICLQRGKARWIGRFFSKGGICSCNGAFLLHRLIVIVCSVHFLNVRTFLR